MNNGRRTEDREPLLEEKTPGTSSSSSSNSNTMAAVGGTSANSSSDPFYTVRDNVNSQVEKIKVRHEQFLGLVKTVDTSTSVDFKELQKGLVKDVRKADRDLGGLKDAVDMVEKNRLKFPHIKDAELGARKKFVGDMQAVLNDVKGGMESAAVRRKMEDDKNKARRGEFDESSDAMHASIERENNRFIADQRQLTKQTIQHQDVQLDHLGQAVDRLGNMGRDINQELKEQNVMLDGLEKDMGDAGEKMNVVMEGLSKLLKTKDGCQIWTIVVLAVILVIMVCLVIWA